MHRAALLLLVAVSLSAAPAAPIAQGRPAWLDPYRDTAARLMQAAQADQFAWDRTAELTDTYGQRISGSDNLESRHRLGRRDHEGGRPRERPHRARDGAPVGARRARASRSSTRRTTSCPCSGLGGSVATPPAGIEADVMVVGNMDELARRSAEAKGKIVLFNVPYTNYGETVAYRSGGARAASRHGAVAALVRSVGPPGCARRTPAA